MIGGASECLGDSFGVLMFLLFVYCVFTVFFQSFGIWLDDLLNDESYRFFYCQGASGVLGICCALFGHLWPVLRKKCHHWAQKAGNTAVFSRPLVF